MPRKPRKRLVAPAKPFKVVLTVELEVKQLDKLIAAAAALRARGSAVPGSEIPAAEDPKDPVEAAPFRERRIH
jgi:hypothetical protein